MYQKYKSNFGSTLTLFKIHSSVVFIVEMNPCDDSPCKHGKCERLTFNTFKCQCDKGYQGRLCDKGIRITSIS